MVLERWSGSVGLGMYSFMPVARHFPLSSFMAIMGVCLYASLEDRIFFVASYPSIFGI